VKILIVEDQLRLANFLRKSLTRRAYTVNSVLSCGQAQDALCESSYDAIVLDIGLPDGDGLELLQRWRAAGFNEPVLILSARDTVQDRIKGLDLGADDYLSKPFSLGELLARLRSLLRRHTGVKQTSFELRGLKLDLLSQSVYLNERLVEMTTREYALLEIFMQNPGRTLPRNVICEKIWESHRDIDRNLLDVYMSRLRSKLDTGPGEPFFRTVYGVGYKFA